MSTTANPRTRSRRATVLAAVATVMGAIALIVAVAALQGRATAAPAPADVAAAAPCAPIRIAPAEAQTRAGSMAEAVAAVRLAAPGREIEVLDLTREDEADVRVRDAFNAGAYYGDRPVILLRAPGDGTGVLWLATVLPEHLPPCDMEEVTSG